MSVTQKQLKQTEKKLRELYEMYTLDVELLIDKLHKEHVVPYCRRHKLSFVAGNGTWFFWTGDVSIGEDDTDKLPAGLHALLTQSIPGHPSMDVGAYMPDFKNPDERQKENV